MTPGDQPGQRKPSSRRRTNPPAPDQRKARPADAADTPPAKATAARPKAQPSQAKEKVHVVDAGPAQEAPEAAPAVDQPEPASPTPQARASGTKRRSSGFDPKDLPRRPRTEDREPQPTQATTPVRPLWNAPGGYLIAAGIVCIIIFFAVQPKPTTPPPVPNPGGVVGTPSSGSSPGSANPSPAPSGTPPLSAPKATHTIAWGPTVITQDINTSFDLLSSPPPQENAIAGFEVTVQPEVSGEVLTTVTPSSIAQWNGSGSPSFADCVKALQGGSASSVPVDTPGVWACAQTPEGLIASLQSKGVATNTPTLITYRFLVTVWKPGK